MSPWIVVVGLPVLLSTTVAVFACRLASQRDQAMEMPMPGPAPADPPYRPVVSSLSAAAERIG